MQWSGKVAVIGNYPPRQCGIATFTWDLCRSLTAQHPMIECGVIAVNDVTNGHLYTPRVKYEIVEGDVSSYREAARYINRAGYDLVCLQHEYGIFGGPGGGNILALLRELKVPLVTTVHTVFREPEYEKKEVMDEIAWLSDRLVLMSRKGAEVFHTTHAVPKEKIEFIPHGIPDVPFADPDEYKPALGWEGKKILLSFGLLSRVKGIESILKALPYVMAKYPNVYYVCQGVTHPVIARAEGESYRVGLRRLARHLGVRSHVIFENRFLTLDELTDFIGGADIYLNSYPHREQAASGTLAYTIGAGKPVISTPYWYAEELLADGRGVLVPFDDPEALGERIVLLLKSEEERKSMSRRAYAFGREMIWSRVARRYVRCFGETLEHKTPISKSARVESGWSSANR